jgi:hypothetical protein
VLDAVHRRAPRSRRTARRIAVLRDQPAGETIFHEVLRRCEHDGLLRSERDRDGPLVRIDSSWPRATPSGSQVPGHAVRAAGPELRFEPAGRHPLRVHDEERKYCLRRVALFM